MTLDTPLRQLLLTLRRETAVLCDAEGTITWTDERAPEILGPVLGRPLLSLVAQGSEQKAAQLIRAVRDGSNAPWEIILWIDERPTLFAVRGARSGDDLLLVLNQLPDEYHEIESRLTAVIGELSVLQRETARRERELARVNDALRQAQEQLREQARLEGVALAARELAHLINNDLAVPMGVLDTLQAAPGISPSRQSMIGEAMAGLHAVSRHVAQLNRVVRIATKDTPVGPSLDLPASTGHE